MALQPLKRTVKNVTVMYSVQAQLMMNKFKDFDIGKFEEEQIKTIIIGDKAISQYVLDKEIKIEREKRKKEKK